MYKIDFKSPYTFLFSVDCVIFGFKNGLMHALLVKETNELFEEEWSIPGDLVNSSEGISETTNRIIKELTKIDNLPFYQGQTFGALGRHPDGRLISTAYFVLMRIDDFDSEASSWSRKAEWIPLHEVPALTIDHNIVLSSTYELLKQNLRTAPLCFDLLPYKFTLNEMQQLFEYAFDLEMDKANFRKKIKSVPLIEHKEKQQNVKHRPAKLFSFNKDEYRNQRRSTEYQFKM